MAEAGSQVGVHALPNFLAVAKGQLNSEWIYEIMVSPKMPTKNYQDFCPGNLLEGRAEILKNFGWHFGRNDDLILKFILSLTDL